MRRAEEPRSLPVSEIEIGERLRPADAGAVEAMIQSIAKRGVLSPVQVLKTKTGYRLLDGLHRLTAALSMGMPEIPVKVHRCGVREGMNIEVEANLARASLTPLDLGLFLARQKELYEAEHPEARLGHMARLARHDLCTDKMSVQSFSANAASKLGRDERTVRRLIAAAKALTPDEVKQLRGAPNKVRLDDLQTLAKCGSAADRALICEALGSGTAQTAKQALKAARAKPGDAIKRGDDRLEKLRDAWTRANKRDRQRFVAEFEAEIAGLISGAKAPGAAIPFKARDRGAA